jgi:hypothetical protein
MPSVTLSRKSTVDRLGEYRSLVGVVASPLFGVSVGSYWLLPIGRDVLSAALDETAPDRWSIEGVVEEAGRRARTTDDISSVGLAAWVGAPVVIAAFRESAVLYFLQGASIERERLGDAQAGAEEHGQERAVADARRGAARAGGAEGFDVGEDERLGGEPARRSPPSGRRPGSASGHLTVSSRFSVGLV